MIDRNPTVAEPFRTILNAASPGVPATSLGQLGGGAAIADEPPTHHEPTVADLMFIAFWSADHVRRMEAILALGHLLGVDRMDGYDALRKPDVESPAEGRINGIIANARQSEFARRVENSAGSNVCETDA